MTQPPHPIRPSGLRKSRSQDADDRRPIEGALATEGVHHHIEIDNDARRLPQGVDRFNFDKHSSRPIILATRTSKGSLSSPTSPNVMDTKGSNELPYRPTPSKPITISTGSIPSAPSTPVGKGHAHDPLEDTLFLDIGTGEDSVSPDESSHIVSESPGAVDINVYETAYREEIDRILSKREATQPGRRPTLYLTRRVENVKSIIRETDAVFDHGRQPPTPSDIKTGFKGLVEKAKKEIENRGEWQKLNEGKEGKLSRITRNVREKKRAVEEEREIIRREDREKEREKVLEKEKDRSRSSTPVAGFRGSSRSRTPVSVDK